MAKSTENTPQSEPVEQEPVNTGPSEQAENGPDKNKDKEEKEKVFKGNEKSGYGTIFPVDMRLVRQATAMKYDGTNENNIIDWIGVGVYKKTNQALEFGWANSYNSYSVPIGCWIVLSHYEPIRIYTEEEFNNLPSV